MLNPSQTAWIRVCVCVWAHTHTLLGWGLHKTLQMKLHFWILHVIIKVTLRSSNEVSFWSWQVNTNPTQLLLRQHLNTRGSRHITAWGVKQKHSTQVLSCSLRWCKCQSSTAFSLRLRYILLLLVRKVLCGIWHLTIHKNCGKGRQNGGDIFTLIHVNGCVLDGGLWKGNFEMVIPSHVVVVQIDQGLDGFLYWRHLDQSHLTVPDEERAESASFLLPGWQSTTIHHFYLYTKYRRFDICAYWKNLKALTVPPLLENRRRRSSSPTPSLNMHRYIEARVPSQKQCRKTDRFNGCSTGCWRGEALLMGEKCSGSF